MSASSVTMFASSSHTAARRRNGAERRRARGSRRRRQARWDRAVGADPFGGAVARSVSTAAAAGPEVLGRPRSSKVAGVLDLVERRDDEIGNRRDVRPAPPPSSPDRSRTPCRCDRAHAADLLSRSTHRHRCRLRHRRNERAAVVDQNGKRSAVQSLAIQGTTATFDAAGRCQCRFGLGARHACGRAPPKEVSAARNSARATSSGRA